LIFLLSQSSDNQVGDPEYIDVKRFVDTWSNSVIWLMLSGFFLAEALKKTGLDKDLFRFSVSRFGQQPRQVVLGIMLVTGVASMIMSNTATTAMMIASIMPFIHKIGPDTNMSKVLLIGVPTAAAVGGMGTIIGSPPNVIAVDAINHILQNRGAETFRIGFLEWMILGVPVALLLILMFWYMLLRTYDIRTESVDLELEPGTQELNPIEKWQKKVVIGVLSVTVLLWLTGNWHGIPAAAVSAIPIICLPMVSIITGDDVRQLPWDTLMLVAGGLSLGLAIKESGLAEFFVSKLQHFSFNAYILMLLFAFATVLFSNIMSNTATATILIPIASILPGVDSVALAVVIGLSASCALFLPVSTPPNAIAFSTGYLKQSDFRLGGSLVGLIGPILAIIWVLVFFQLQV
jgi:sodium-dependent dicarboxylate transporter 2/3/5